MKNLTIEIVKMDEDFSSGADRIKLKIIVVKDTSEEIIQLCKKMEIKRVAKRLGQNKMF